ncbi:MAG: hypothetical protein M0R77_00475 [Gammaproteobacteria bacterium]|nr:hypothetical protein [Acholeplasmataceae bacterium]MCK9529029.1 hypothetical protein [Gammaproteobacteria bacterium]
MRTKVNKKKKLSLSLETISEGTSVERELEIYALLDDLSVLTQADAVEQQEQFSIVPVIGEGHKGSTRVRKTINKDGTTFIHTTKVRQTDGSNLETEEETTEDMFNAYKALANDGLIKDRFFFPVKGHDLLWEVDVFPQDNGEYAQWVKIDLEIPEGVVLKELPELPFPYKEKIVKSNDPEVKKRIGKLYKDFFSFKKGN